MLKDKLKSFCLQNSIEIYHDDFYHDEFRQSAVLKALFPLSDRYSYDRESTGIQLMAKHRDYVNLCPFKITVPKLQEQGWVGSSAGGVYLFPVDIEAIADMPVGSFRVILSRSLGEDCGDAYGRDYSPDMLDQDNFAETVIEDAQALIDSAKSRIEFFSDRPEGGSLDRSKLNCIRLGGVLQVELGWYWVYGKKGSV